MRCGVLVFGADRRLCNAGGHAGGRSRAVGRRSSRIRVRDPVGLCGGHGGVARMAARRKDAQMVSMAACVCFDGGSSAGLNSRVRLLANQRGDEAITMHAC
eukprot:363932-Chlamydomonas_euryale.AAC.11